MMEEKERNNDNNVQTAEKQQWKAIIVKQRLRKGGVGEMGKQKHESGMSQTYEIGSTTNILISVSLVIIRM